MGTNHTEQLQDRFLRRVVEADGFRYFWPDGQPYLDPDGLARIASLAVPPAYVDVFVNPDPEAELQAFGRDAGGRLQYRYHPDFVHRNAMRKWRRLARFAAALPQLRAVVDADVRRAGLPKRKILALLTRLLYRIYVRVGSTSYTRRYRSYGLTTLCKRHVGVEGNRVVFCYRGKRGVVQQQSVSDRCLAVTVGRLLKLPGKALFQYLDDEGACRPLRAADLNAYIREAMGPFTAKDFRTWGGTLMAAEYLAAKGPSESERAASRVISHCVREVASGLGNTAAVTRASYICPVIFDRYLAGRVLDDFAPDENDQVLTRSETALKRMLARGVRGNASANATRSAAPATPRRARGRKQASPSTDLQGVAVQQGPPDGSGSAQALPSPPKPASFRSASRAVLAAVALQGEKS